MPGRTASLLVRVFDGSRRPIPRSLPLLIRLRDGAGRMVSAKYHRGPAVYFNGLPIQNGFADDFSVIVSARGHLSSAYAPVRLSAERLAALDLMLVPRQGEFQFAEAKWSALQRARPRWTELLECGPYERLMEERPAALAGLLNLLAALEQTTLGEGPALDRLGEVIWDPAPAPDRFFAWARVELLEQIRRAAAGGGFVPTLLPSLLHPGATASFKEVRFPFANLQITFHERRRRQDRGTEYLMIEPDIDYYRDPAAHALLEVLPNNLLGRTSDPRIVYQLRWTASRRAGAAEFSPPYTIG